MSDRQRDIRPVQRALAWIALAAFAPALASAAPQGEQVVSGNAAFARDGTTTQITTTTPQTIVILEPTSGPRRWIDQPDAASRILNNVLATDPDAINGTLTSNGQVDREPGRGSWRSGDRRRRPVVAARVVDAGDFAGAER